MIHHYKSSQMILTVGDGDFSFSACLARAFRYAHNMVATSIDSLDTLKRRYGNFEKEWDELKRKGCTVLFEVDVHNMNTHPTLRAMKFDVIVYNFPHAGHIFGLRESSSSLIEMHKKLMRGFFRSARGMVKRGGEVHVAHRDDFPYSSWELEKQAQAEGFVLKEKSPFSTIYYPGYNQKRGGTICGDNTFNLGSQPFTFKFCLDRDQQFNGHAN